MMPEILQTLKELLYVIAKKVIYFDELGIYSDFGFDDAMVTGISTGVMNGAVYNILAGIDRASNLKKWHVELNPDFNNKRLYVKLHSIIRIKIVHIIVMVPKLVKIFFKIGFFSF